MLISSLRFVSFRNVRDAEVATQAKDVFLVGENGQGKTNFLEGVYFCSYASSFRSVNDRELICNTIHNAAENGEANERKSKGCSVQARFMMQTTPVLYEKVLVKIEDNRKTIIIDGKKVEDRKELLSVAPCIVFCHEDMVFAAGTPENRRWFFDQSQSLCDPVYVDDLRNYRKILRSRNIVLKDYENDALYKTQMLDVLDPQLARYGIHIMKKRSEAVRLFSQTFTPLYAYVSGIDNIEVRYIPSWNLRAYRQQRQRKSSAATSPADAAANDSVSDEEPDEETIVALLKNRREGDCSFGVTMTGPHRDKYAFTCKGADFARTASTGQRRLLVLLLRAAEARRFSDMSGKKPILLLDDVLLELDPEKRYRFLEVLPEYDQAFYTFLPEEPYLRYQKFDTIVYKAANGVLSRMDG
ncbi:MAG: DNA replication and repair protein RecF [Treponema sp.]|jgi:DNA replication and repair protein RecF|nr:DNA replication and repair protein RecF [Treponema sp.]